MQTDNILGVSSPIGIQRGKTRSRVNRNTGTGNNWNQYSMQNIDIHPSQFRTTSNILQIDVRLLYGYVILNDWSLESISRIVESLGFEQSRYMIESLQPLHDDGGDPPR